ncbi:tetratricopeptide repeat protein [Haliscomenobacter sp.]|uniref:tetratricopeptide repeat protein n=1 Tax=Haliscomenobacter sp. TaxID=2717303 RepID=UPI003593D5D2
MKKTEYLMKWLIVVFLFFSFTTLSLTQEENFMTLVGRAVDFQISGDYSQALKNYEKAFDIAHNKMIRYYYNAARCASMIGDNTKAIHFLNKCIDLGYIDVALLTNDEDFKPMKDKNELQSIINRIEQKKSAFEKQFVHAKTIALTDFIPFFENEEWGYVQKNTKRILVNAQFAQVSFAGHCLVIWTSGESYFCIDQKGHLFIQDLTTPMTNEINVETEDIAGGLMEISPMPDIPRFVKVDSTKGFTGFKMDKYNNILSASSVFDQYKFLAYDDIIPQISHPMKIEEQWYAIASKKNQFGLVNEKGVSHAKIGFEYQKLLPVQECKDAGWFFFKDKKEKCGFINVNGEVRLYGLVTDEAYSSHESHKKEEHFDFIISEVNGEKLIIDLKTISQKTDPFKGELLAVDYTYSSNQCILFKPKITSDKIVAYYFLIKGVDEKLYYIGDDKVQYLVN